MSLSNCACRIISGSAFRTGYLLMLVVIITFDWLDDVTCLLPNASATSASSNKTVFDFHFFDVYALKSSNAS